MSVTNTRFFPFLDQFGPVFPVFGLKIIQKWYDFGQNSLFTLLDGQKPDFWGRMDRKTEKRVFFCPYYCIWDQFHLYHFLIWGKKKFLKVQEGSKFPYFFPFLEAVGSSSYHLLPSLAVTWVTTDAVKSWGQTDFYPILWSTTAIFAIQFVYFWMIFSPKTGKNKVKRVRKRKK